MVMLGLQTYIVKFMLYCVRYIKPRLILLRLSGPQNRWSPSMTKKPKSKRASPLGAARLHSPVIEVTRRTSQVTRLLLFVRAGARCQFDGCNEFLLEHPLTVAEGNFAQMAHIVAFSHQGPRGEARPRPVRINDVANLMLLCPQCHKLIDDQPDRYTIGTLEKYKRNHEERIRHVTGLGPDLKTTVVQLKARVAGQSVAIPIAQVTEAVAPRYPTDAKGHVIDLTDIDAEGEAFIEMATRVIKQRVERLYEPGMDVEDTRHISLFALAPIPLLVFLGRHLSNKVPVDLYQRHRDTEDWVWKRTGAAVEYSFERVRHGTDRTKVAFMLSLSGTIRLDLLPSEIDESFTVYELTLSNLEPSPTFLRTKENLNHFKGVYQVALRTILRDHGNIDAIHLFPAVPAPIAVLCGRELLPKLDPALLVYDYDKRIGGFTLAMRVN